MTSQITRRWAVVEAARLMGRILGRQDIQITEDFATYSTWVMVGPYRVRLSDMALSMDVEDAQAWVLDQVLAELFPDGMMAA